MTTCYQPLGSVVIRRATPADAVALGDLARLTWRRCFAGMITSAQIEYMLAQRYETEDLASRLSSPWPAYELLLLDGEPVAFAAHGPDEPGTWKLHQLYVHPEWQHRGLGGRLMDHVEQCARAAACRQLLLTVNRNNARARTAYQRRGFDIRESAQFDIGNGFIMDDFVMVKALRTGPGHPTHDSSPG